MGRIKTTSIKNIAFTIIENYRNNLTTDFEKNKEFLKKILDVKSKKIINIIAGYITREMKRCSS